MSGWPSHPRVGVWIIPNFRQHRCCDCAAVSCTPVYVSVQLTKCTNPKTVQTFYSWLIEKSVIPFFLSFDYEHFTAIAEVGVLEIVGTGKNRWWIHRELCGLKFPPNLTSWRMKASTEHQNVGSRTFVHVGNRSLWKMEQFKFSFLWRSRREAVLKRSRIRLAALCAFAFWAERSE